MSLVPSEEERMVADSVRGLLARLAPVSAFRTLRDSGDPARYLPELWSKLAEDGFAAPQISGDFGGVGMGYTAAGLVAWEMGRVLAATPFLATAIAAEIVMAGGTERQRETLLPELAAGATIISVAFDERARHDPEILETTATRTVSGWRLTGSKRAVIDGGIAQTLIIPARADQGGIGLFLVPADALGLGVLPLGLIDNRNFADVTLDHVAVGADALLGATPDGERAVARSLDVGRVLLAAELLGIAEEAFERTVGYLKEREQFGQKIGSFQALQHRAARLHVALEMARGVVMKALRALDTGEQGASLLASLAKAQLTKTARDVLNEAVQMHGGIGVTDDFDLGFFFKRARVAGDLLGDDYFHRDRLGRLAWSL